MAIFWVRWLPLVGLALFAGLVVYLIRPPRPLPATAPATEFSAERAWLTVREVARQPHSTGTPANAMVRDYLMQQCRALGLRPVVQDTSVLVTEHGGIMLGRVQNIVARLPGRQPGGKAVLVLAHYDSQPHTPGAGDDAAGVAAMLEAMRALRAGPPLAHDVIWLFTDGEEAGLLGASAYAADTARLRREVGMVLNFEGRGNRGPSLTFEVSSQNGWVMREYARAAPTPLASSLFYEAYRHLPNDTDFTPLRKAGLTGLNFAFVDGYSYYHSPADTPAHLDRGSLQHHGEYLLSLVRHFGTISLAQTKAPDYTFFNPLGSWLVLYPASWNLPLTGFVILLLLGVMAMARQRRHLSWPSLLGGALAWLGGLLLVGLASWGGLLGIKALNPDFSAFYDSAFYNVLTYQIGLLALGGAVFMAYYGWLGRRVRPDTLVGGALLVVAVLLGLLQWQAASSAFLLAFPLLFATLAWARRLRRVPPLGAVPASGLVDCLLLLPTVALLGQTTYLLFVLFALGNLMLLALLFLALLLGLLLPVLLPALGQKQQRAQGLLPGLGLLGTLVALLVGQATSRHTAGQPQQTHLYYVLDANCQRAYWLSALTTPSAWLRQVLTQPYYGPLPSLLAGPTTPILHQSAPVITLEPPSLIIQADKHLAGRRYLHLVLYSGRDDVSSLRLSFLNPKQVRSLHLGGHLVPSQALASGSAGAITFVAPRLSGEEIDLEAVDTNSLRLVVITRSPELPLVPGLPALPATYVPSPGYNSFTTQVKKEFLLDKYRRTDVGCQ